MIIKVRVGDNMGGIWWQGYKYQKNIFFIIILLLSMLLGGIVSFFPILTFVCVSAILFLIWLICKPKRIPLFLLVLASVSMPIVFRYTILGFDADTLYKLMTILIILISIKKYGINLRSGLTLLALYILLIFTYILSDLHPRMDPLDPFISFLGLMSYFLILLVKWDEKMSNKIIQIIVFLPLISVSIGFILDIFGIHTLIYEEYFGGRRLQGANIAAHLAMLAFIGFCVSLIETKRNTEKKFFFFSMSVVNFFILLSTGTRGPLIACIFILLVLVADHIKDFFKGKIFIIFPLILFVVTIMMFIIVQWENIMQRTFNDNSGEIGINLSGREVAWQYFMSQSRGAELFGQGLGASLVANDGSLYSGFIVPHNEYIRFYFDNGFVGLILLFGSLLFVLINISNGLSKKVRIYYFSFILGFILYSFVDNTLSTIQFIVPFCFYLSALSSLHMKNQTSKGKNSVFKIVKKRITINSGSF